MSGTNAKEHWAELYRRALFEQDPDKLHPLLEEARRAVQLRVHELWYSPTYSQDGTDKERRELHAAAYYLDLLQSLETKSVGVEPL